MEGYNFNYSGTGDVFNPCVCGRIGRECIICGESFDLYGHNDPRMICHECIKRLNQILYPDKE